MGGYFGHLEAPKRPRKPPRPDEVRCGSRMDAPMVQCQSAAMEKVLTAEAKRLPLTIIFVRIIGLVCVKHGSGCTFSGFWRHFHLKVYFPIVLGTNIFEIQFCNICKTSQNVVNNDVLKRLASVARDGDEDVFHIRPGSMWPSFQLSFGTFRG